jgi:hypothetical protein
MPNMNNRIPLVFGDERLQENRELAVRGVDGRGLHILDVLPSSFAHVPGIEEALEARKRRVESIMTEARAPPARP